MGYGIRVTGHLTIVPPLNAEELRQHPEFQLRDFGMGRSNQECYVEVERHTDTTPTGETVTLTGPRILVVSPDEEFNRSRLEEQLQAIVTEYYPLGHRFTGYLQLLGEDGDIWRLVDQEGVVKEVRPVLVWPDDMTKTDRR